MEKDLLKSYARTHHWQEKSNWPNGEINEDSVGTYDDIFQNKLLQYTSHYPLTLEAHFTEMQKALYILTSDDGLFRIYCWDNMQGGTMRFFDAVFQFKSGDKVKSCFLPHPDTIDVPAPETLNLYNKLYTFKTGNSTYYLAVYTNIESSLDNKAGIKVFTIQNGVLNDTVRIIKTKTGLHNILSYDYENLPSGSDHSIYFNKFTNTIYIPLVDEYSNVTNRYIKYRFTGTYFEKVEAGK